MSLPGLTIGHQTLSDKGTGLSVFLFDQRASANYFICGASPATSKLEFLQHGRDAKIDALVFSGGSAYGLGAVTGVMEWLREQGRGYNPSSDILVPIVPMACIFDLTVKGFYYPQREDGYAACENATNDNQQQGKVGVGCGATVAKLLGAEQGVSGGLGYASIQHQSGLLVSSYAVVNSVGNIMDQNGKVIAGLDDANVPLSMLPEYRHGKNNLIEKTNTTLVAIFTNATLNRQALLTVSKMAAAGIARAIKPAFTPFDGDVVFAVSLGEVPTSPLLVGQLAADMTQCAIVNAVSSA